MSNRLLITGLSVFLLAGCNNNQVGGARYNGATTDLSHHGGFPSQQGQAAAPADVDSKDPQQSGHPSAFGPSDAVKRARADLARGETRFFWVFEGEGNFWNPPGIRSCSPVPNAMRKDKATPYDDAQPFSTQGERDGLISYDYRKYYNWTMATVHPASLRANCAEPTPRIDKRFRSSGPSEYDIFIKQTGIR
jgi:hypothetical protein